MACRTSPASAAGATAGAPAGAARGSGSPPPGAPSGPFTWCPAPRCCRSTHYNRLQSLPPPAVPVASALELIRGTPAPPARPAAPPIQAVPTVPIAPSRSPGAPITPCPFTFGPWQPRPAPLHPREAACLVHHHGRPVAWWRREWVPPLPLPNYSPPITLEPFAQDALYSLAGEVIAVSLCPQSLLEHLAASL
jgi:hypothetical protein